ncbi:M20/M25/M40 family metallo-hydrolase [Candidatus Woesebacteria bacterium]|nr:M20/M25/M40 family metallo-hydrolase [Candidatus Woesebacteria bacterium]
MDNISSVATLIKQLITIKSTADNPEGLEAVLDLACSHLQEYKTEQYVCNGVKSVLIHNQPKNPKRFKIILNGHLDVVAGKDHLYTPIVTENKMRGVGAWDMKSGAACLIAVFKEVANKVSYPLGLQLTTDEELGGFNGTKFQVDSGVRADFVITGEPTNLNIVHKAKGILRIRISCEGSTGHGAYPWKGDNAIWKMNSFLNTLQRKLPLLKNEQWVTTYNLSTIQTTNTALNKIPDDCSINLDVRYAPSEKDSWVETLNNLIQPSFRMDILADEPGAVVDLNNSYLQNLHDISSKTTGREVLVYGAHGSSDVRHFARVGGAGVEFGLSGGEIGTDDEWVDLLSLEPYINILKQFLLSMNP